ncbi:MAG: hypothetical protein WCD20_02045 [Rhodomicrobium sp.]
MGTHLFRGVHSAVHASVAALTWWVLQHWEQLQAHSAAYKNYALPAVLAGLALLFRMSYPLSTMIVEKIPFFSSLLRRALIGKDFIEGDWPLVVVDMEKGEPLYYGFLNIDFCDGQLYVSGDDWNPDGNHAQAFHSVQSLYRNRTLQYWYEQGQSLHSPDMRGYTEIFFFPDEGLAKRNAGKFLDVMHTRDIRFYSKKQHYGLFERHFGEEDTAKKLEAARQLWGELEPKLAFLRTRSINADFV